METAEILQGAHPLVRKAAQEWIDYATSYGVAVTVRPMSDMNDERYTTSWPDGLILDFATGSWTDRGSVMIYPPSRKGRTVRQTPMVMTYYRSVGGKLRYGCKPKGSLQILRDYINSYWSPTWGERLRAEAEAIRASQARQAARREMAVAA